MMHRTKTLRLPAMIVFSAMLLAGAARAGQTDLDAWRDADATAVHGAVALARRAFDAYVLRRDVVDPPATLSPLLRRRAAVFVSAMRHGAPRCCMGTLYPLEPDAAHEIVSSAVAAAGRDRRFPPIKPSELHGLTLIVSIVSAPRSITEAEIHALDPTREGLAVRYGDRIGVVLSRETSRVDRMIEWARIRAGAPAGRRVEYLLLHDIRFVEGETAPQR